MSNEVTVFTMPVEIGAGSIRIMGTPDDPKFITADVAKALGSTNAQGTTRALADDEKGYIVVITPGGPQALSYVTESGLYRILMRSNSPKARVVQDWIARDVLPTIRKTGGYVVGQEKLATGEMSGEEFLAKALLFAKTTLDRLQDENTQFTAVNKVLTLEYEQVTTDEWRASNHIYFGLGQSSQELGKYATKIARVEGIPLETQTRVIHVRDWRAGRAASQ